MTVNQVVLVDQTHEIDATLLQAAAVALNIQVTQHLASIWPGVTASVSAAPSAAALPPGAWPVFLVKSLPPGEGGYHLDKKNQPFAKVIASAEDQTWTIDASHEICEMLVDPYGNRMQSSEAITISGSDVIDCPGVFSYLVEACDPCEANNYAYDIQGIAVSDFITPHFYDSSPAAGVKYSYTGAITRPRQLLPGGYISYQKADGTWQQILWVDPGQPPTYNNLGVTSARSWREELHNAMGEALDRAKHAQRRKAGALPKGSEARVTAYSHRREDEAAREAEAMARYHLASAGAGAHLETT
jgi:hypothetical protein